MKSTWLFGLTAAVWGLLLGGLAAWSVMAMAAGVSWLFLFGDDPWPAALDWVIPSIGLAVLLAVSIGCMAFGLRAARALTRAGPDRVRRQRRTALGLLVLGSLLGLALAGAAAARIAEQESARETAAQQARWFEDLDRGRQRLDGIEVVRAPRPMSYDMTVTTLGADGGVYRLAWSLRSGAYGAILAEGVAALTLSPGKNNPTLAIDARSIVERYHEVALGGRDVNVEVAESFRIEVTLTPQLSETDRARLPAHEVQNLAIGQSSLNDRTTTEFAMQFRIAGPVYELLD